MDSTTQQQQIARSAAIVSLGNVLSRIMGLVRESVIAGIFGASGAVSAYKAARQVPLTLYEMLVGGMVSSALVPTFTEYAARDRRDELWHIASLLFTVAVLGLGLVVLLLELGTPLLTRALVRFDTPALQALTTSLLRIAVVGVFFLGLSGLITALCHALQRFALPAFTTVVFNASIVAFALILGPRWIEQVESPAIEDLWGGDVVSGEIDERDDGTLLAKSLVVAPSGATSGDVLGTVVDVEGQTLTLEGQRGEFRVLADDETVFRVSRRQIRVLAMGLVLGAALQVVLQLPALRDMRFRPAVDLRHPVLRQILKLYAPVILSLIVAGLGVVIDRNLASRTGESSISWMSFATTLREFPLGLVSMAISTAILPTLAAQAARESSSSLRHPLSPERSAAFRATLASSLRLVLVLILPAAVGLLVLARPLIALLFQHGEFGGEDTAQTALALRYYLVGMVFAAVDLPLVFAFYARKDTWRPALVGILGVLCYLVVALPTYRTLGMIGLILANDAQLAGHALVMIWLFERRIGALGGHGIGETLLKSLIGSAIMGGAVYGAMRGLEQLLPIEGLLGWAATVIVGGGIGLGVYLGVCALLRVRELDLVRGLIRQLARGSKSADER